MAVMSGANSLWICSGTSEWLFWSCAVGRESREDDIDGAESSDGGLEEGLEDACEDGLMDGGFIGGGDGDSGREEKLGGESAKFSRL